MSRRFVELIIKAPFLLVKGLLLGHRHGREEPYPYFFHRKAGIRRETIMEAVREIFEMDNYTCLCLPEDIADEFTSLIETSEDMTGAQLKEKKNIEGAEFSFSFEIFCVDLSDCSKNLFRDLPEGVRLVNYKPEEVNHQADGAAGGYAPSHPYVFRGQGKAVGDFEGTMNLFLRIKKSEASESILCSELRLQLEGSPFRSE
jgi:hypothetical protein